MSIDKVLEERGRNYGEFYSHAYISQSFKRMARQAASWNKLSPSQSEAIEMICHKIARILNGDPDYVDSWVDIVGYAQLVVNELLLAKEKLSG